MRRWQAALLRTEAGCRRPLQFADCLRRLLCRFKSLRKQFQRTLAPASLQTRAVTASSAKPRLPSTPARGQAVLWSPSLSSGRWHGQWRSVSGSGSRSLLSKITRKVCSATRRGAEVGSAASATPAPGPLCERRSARPEKPGSSTRRLYSESKARAAKNCQPCVKTPGSASSPCGWSGLAPRLISCQEGAKKPAFLTSSRQRAALLKAALAPPPASSLC